MNNKWHYGAVVPDKKISYVTYGFEIIIPCKYNGIRVKLIKRGFSYETKEELQDKLEYYATEFNTNYYYEII